MNQNNKPLLSICIPTYDHCAYLQEALDSVLNQIDDSNRESLEIVISDNGSSDKTPELIEALKKKSPVSVSSNRNKENLGYDLNCLKVVEIARGQYCWLLGDDDQILPGAINKMLAEIKTKPQVDIFIANKEDFALTFSQRMKFKPLFNNSTEMVFDFSRVAISDYFKISKKLICFFNYISILVFKRQRWQAVKGREDFVGSKYIHVFMFMALLWKDRLGVLKYLPDKIVARRWGSDRIPAIVERLKEDVVFYDSLARNIFADKLFYVRKLNSLVLKNDGFSWAVRARNIAGLKFYTEVFPFLLKRFWSYPLFWLKIFPLLFVPVSLLKLMRWGYRRVIKGEAVSRKDLFQD